MNYLAALLVCSTLIAGREADVPDPPDLRGWNMVGERVHLEIKGEDAEKVFTEIVGFTEDYQNPNDPTERVRVVKKIIPLIPAEMTMGDDPTSPTSIISNYIRKKSNDKLKKRYENSEAIAYMRYHLLRDARTGRTESWLRTQEGPWIYREGVEPDRSTFSEPSKDDPEEPILVGIKFSLGGEYRILKIDQDFIVKHGRRP